MSDLIHHRLSQLAIDAPLTALSISSAQADHDEVRLEKIRVRLRSELPMGPYFTDSIVAQVMGISTKRLQNLRAERGQDSDKSYPPFIVLDGRRGARYPRELVVDFFARQEAAATGRLIHRCR